MPTNPLLTQARAAYIVANYEKSLELNRLAASEGDPVGLRFAGLCLFRLDRWPESKATLLEARDRLPTPQQPYVLNHLGATLRALGEFDAAESSFLQGLNLADAPEQADARGRLHGSLGALYDELQYRHRAVEHYARFEELMRLHGTPLKQANAVGLLARHAARANDLERAEELGNKELSIAKQHGQRELTISALCHLAFVHSRRSELAEGPKAAGHANRARSHYEDALGLADEIGLTRRRVSTRRQLGRFETDQGNLTRAWTLLDKARRLVATEIVAENDRAGVFEALAKWASKANLHGEALYYLEHAWQQRESLQGCDPRLSKARAEKHASLRKQLATEAMKVTRSPEEINRLDGLSPDWRSSIDDERLPHWRWLQEATQEAVEVWGTRLGGAWSQLPENVQTDLVQAHTLYRSTTDLGVVTFLLARALEKLGRAHWTEAKGNGRNNQPTLHDLVCKMPQELRRGLECISDVAGNQYKLVQLRNDFAHGNPMHVDRIAADAVIRVLSTETLPGLVALMAK